MRLERIGLVNVQSIRAADLEIGGVTVITGPGFVGKSSIIRALQAVFLGVSGDHLIRQGQDATGATLTFDTGDVLTWEKRRGKGATWGLNGVPFDRTGGRVPQAIEDFLGIAEVEIDTGLAVTPQLHGQLDGPFLLGQSPSRITRILGRLTKLDILVRAQMAARKEGLAARREQTEAGRTAEVARGRLQKLPDVDALQSESKLVLGRLEDLEVDVAGLTEAQEYASALPALERQVALGHTLPSVSARVGEATALLARFEEIRKVYDPIIKPRRDLAQYEKVRASAAAEVERASAALQEAYAEASLCETCPLREEA